MHHPQADRLLAAATSLLLLPAVGDCPEEAAGRRQGEGGGDRLEEEDLPQTEEGYPGVDGGHLAGGHLPPLYGRCGRGRGIRPGDEPEQFHRVCQDRLRGQAPVLDDLLAPEWIRPLRPPGGGAQSQGHGPLLQVRHLLLRLQRLRDQHRQPDGKQPKRRYQGRLPGKKSG